MAEYQSKSPQDQSNTKAIPLESERVSNESDLEFKNDGQITISQLQTNANKSPQVTKITQLQSMANRFTDRQFPLIQKKENNTGLPDNLKSGIEQLSGHSMDDVKVHYNSGKPAQLNAHAYAQGSEIHLGSGQEKHLPHEAWHVVQQKQGRVKPTKQLKGKVNINDDTGLEQEADVMGARALQMKASDRKLTKLHNNSGNTGREIQPRTKTSKAVVQRKISTDKLNVIGETHSESDGRRPQEIEFTKAAVGHGAGY